MRRMLLVAAVIVGTVCRPVAAQTDPAPPRFELGGHLGALTLTDFGDAASTFLWGPRVSARVTDKLGVEMSADLKRSSHPGGYRSLYGLYYVAGKYTFRRSRASGLNLFATFGGVGSFSRVSWPASSYTRPDGVRLTAPAGERSRMYAPQAVVGGIGMERPLNSHLAVRLSAEGVFGRGPTVGVRLCGGLSVPIGKYRTD